MSIVFYDPENGNDTTGAGSEASPWATGQKCLDNVLQPVGLRQPPTPNPRP